VVLFTALSRSVDFYLANPNDKFLLGLLKKFDKLLEHKKSFFLVERIFPLYNSNPEKFKKILKEALDKEDYDKFMQHLNNQLREFREGNG